MVLISGSKYKTCLAVLMSVLLSGCADVVAPDARNVDIPTPVAADKRKRATNERPDSVMYLPLGEDVLVPETLGGDAFPVEQVGPFELRGETLAGALQLILAEYDISLAFESQEGLSRKITVSNLKGDLGNVVDRVCSLANLYCSFENNTITVKDTQTFTVTMPPIGQGETPTAYMDDVAKGLAAILGTNGSAPIVDPSTRTVVYTATARSAELANKYFQRLRANTAMIVFETYIWEVSLDSGNSTGIDWDMIDSFGKFETSISLVGSAASDFTNPVSIGLPTTKSVGASPTDLVEFLSQFGAVKTISQPQITVLSGSSAELRVADTQNYVSQISTTITDSQSTTSATTDSVDSGFTLSIGSSWDKSTVYANINIDLTNVLSIDDFTFSDGGAAGTSTSIQLPQTTQRELTTQVRVRPGDSILIAGLVQEKDNYSSRGPGFMEPVIPDSRTATTENLELVFLLRPRVVVYSAAGASSSQQVPVAAIKSSPAAPTPMVQQEAPAPAPIVEAAPIPQPVTMPEPVVAKPVAMAPVAPAVAPTAPVLPVSRSPSVSSAPAPLAPVATVSSPGIDVPETSFTSDPLPVAPPVPVEVSAPAVAVSSSSKSEPSYKSVRPKISSRTYAGSNTPVKSYGARMGSSASTVSSARSAAPVSSDAVEIFDVSGDSAASAPAAVSRENLSNSGYSTYGSDNPSLYDTTEYKN